MLVVFPLTCVPLSDRTALPEIVPPFNPPENEIDVTTPEPLSLLNEKLPGVPLTRDPLHPNWATDGNGNVHPDDRLRSMSVPWVSAVPLTEPSPCCVSVIRRLP